DDATIFKLAPDGTLTVLHSFDGGDGAYPAASLALDGTGNLYGTTSQDGFGYGTVFKLAADGTHTVLHNFGIDGYDPLGGVVLDGNGNLYGTTFTGYLSTFIGASPSGGTVFKLTPDGTHTLLHSFAIDGFDPFGGVVLDGTGSLYGTTLSGGASFGVVFKLAPDGTQTVLHRFAGSEGAFPFAGPILDGSGNLYGTTLQGGALDDTGYGTI